MARECHRKKGSFFSWRLLSRKCFLKVDLAEERCAGGACGALGRARHWFQSFLSEPVLSDGPLGWSLKLPWSFPFCWAHRDVVNPPGLRESGICLYFNSVGNSLVLCLLSWSLFSQTLGCLLWFVLKCIISFGDRIVSILEFGSASFSFLFHLSGQHTFAFDYKSKCRKPGNYRKAHRHTKKTKRSCKHST